MVVAAAEATTSRSPALPSHPTDGPPPEPGGAAAATVEEAPGRRARPRAERRSRQRRAVVLVAAATATAVLVASGVWVLAHRTAPQAPRVTASNDSATADATALVTEGGSRAEAAWAASGDPVGAWVQLHWTSPRTVDRVRLVPAAGAPPVTSGLLTLDGGASVMVTAGADGTAEASFPERSVSTARFTASGGESGAGLAGLLVDDGGDPPVLALARTSSGGDSPPLAGATATASSSADGTAPGALVDGDLPERQTGSEWRSATDDDAPWVELAWPQPQLLSAVQVFGPERAASDPSATGASPLSGRLYFSDGSSAVVSGIDGGAGQPTTVAVAPRTVTSVRLTLTENFSSARAGLRELAAYGVGATPVRWDGESTAEQDGETYAVEPPAAQCGGDPVGSAAGGALALVCPAVGSVVGGSAEVVVSGQPGAVVTATTAATTAGSAATTASAGAEAEPVEVASATADADGRAQLVVDTSAFPAGPFALDVTQASGDTTPLQVQLVHGGGQPTDDAGHAPAGMTLQWEDDFAGPLPVSGTGAGAVYAATKPEHWGGAQFGDAVFPDPALGADTVATLAGGDAQADSQGGYLRLRAQPIGDLAVERPYGQQHAGGILSSARVGAAGFSAQYGYFEARMLSGAGKGTWPAFWMLNSQSATPDNSTAGEVDAVELYGHDTSFTCHTLHDWGAPDDSGSTASSCLSPPSLPDWSQGWHDFGVRVTPDGATFYVDGVQVAERRGLGRSDEPMFFLLDMALGGGWPVDLGPTGGTSDLYVDWVRAYT
ncbi:family 16 glycosylhydrolase [Quadrisphaera sp. INWT6]|uniref:glycoside hydrolase family 16 protein n=1 Tax=Quadrisphaera sp. INWT6 TaxID=2596917 RepID=UPI0018923C88|nr:glycoside hydrolase family 16 protein [Quadrisphaera sp. INWT6]MBF5080324.1 glycoside hydrolase family 16 protein [Quadrisphaera sp. INWT6]